MMKKFTLILILFLTLTINLYSQDTNIANYFPLKVGNVWVYYFNNMYKKGHSAGYNKYRITGTTQLNGKTYFQFQRTTYIVPTTGLNCQSYIYQINSPLRTDSITGNLYSPNCLLESLNSQLNDSVNTCNFIRRCIETTDYISFGSVFQAKQFRNYEGQSDYRIDRYAKNIGIVTGEYHWNYGDCYRTLRGCLIDGVLYGDTNTVIVGIHEINPEIPDQFSLSQNFPNPFNPETQISYELPNSEFVYLIVYDVMGKEIETLVNEKQTAGSYTITFNAANYPSGVYYYRLSAGEFKETRKMLLIK